MAQIKSIDELRALRDRAREEAQKGQKENVQITVGMATCGIAAGAKDCLEAILDEAKNQNVKNIKVVKSGCLGTCYAEPTVEIKVPGKDAVLYGNVTPESAREIVKKHIINGEIVTSLAGSAKISSKQVRIALRNCGIIDPEDINDYICADGYQALADVVVNKKPQDVIDVLKKSGLRGRGGAGFPTGLKFEFARKYESPEKYIICNADEGDPGAFMDRSVLEGDPHTVLEAMTIAGYAIGANTGYIYVRAEYPLAIERLNIAIAKAKELGFLGNNIFGSDFSFDILIRYGAGAFVCGEETSLINSIEGKRGEPRNKPPFPAEKGLWNKPTTVNNVETFANIVPIMLKGADWFLSIGTEKSKGTKVFALAGKVNNVGLVEVPMGTTLREIIYEIGGGIKDNKQFKAAQTGGPSGGCIPPIYLDTPIDYESLAQIGSMMGSGGLIVMDEDNCMVDIAKFYLGFCVDESCGKCTPCRIGNKRLFEILERVTSGKGTRKDLDKLKELGSVIRDTALCGLGQTSPNPVLSTMKYFWDEYVAHVDEKRCPSGSCEQLLGYKIMPEKCTGCTLCTRACPAKCISGEVKKPHVIDQEKCIKCGACFDTCKFKAITKG